MKKLTQMVKTKHLFLLYPLFSIILWSCSKDLDLPYPELAIQSAFSPNGDIRNEVWLISNQGNYDKITVTVTSIDLGVVYFAENYTNNWAGRNIMSDSNEMLPTGTYFYVIEVPNLRPVSGQLFINTLRN